MGRPPKNSRSNEGDNVPDRTTNKPTIPLLSWSSGNRNHPWNLKRRANTTRHYILPMPSIEESTYQSVLSTLQQRRRQSYDSLSATRKKETQERMAQEVAAAEELCKIAEQQVELASAKVKLVREKLENLKKQYELAKAELKKTLQQREDEVRRETDQEILKLEEEIKGLKEQEEKVSIPTMRSIAVPEATSSVNDTEISESAVFHSDSAIAGVKRREDVDLADGQPFKRVKLSSEIYSSTEEMAVDKLSTEGDDSKAVCTVESKGAFSQDSAAVEAKKGEGISSVSRESCSEKHSEAEDKKESDVKRESLEKIKTEVAGLNQTKSQMIWLLKQVITAENKRKEEAKRKMSVSEAKPSSS